MNLFNEVDFTLQKVDLLLESYVDIPTYSSIFFEGNKEKDDKVVNADAVNEKVEGESTGLLQKACGLIRKIFGKVGEIIQSCIDYFKRGGKAKDDEERKSFDEFARMCKENPEFRNKKVTIHDYRQINKAYEDALSEAEKQYKNMRETEESERPSFITDCKNKIDATKKRALQLVKTAGTAFTVQAAIDYAKTSKEAAANVQMMINYDMGLLKAIENQIGTKQMKKAKRQIKHLNSRLGVIRMIAGWRQDHALTLKESIKETFDSIVHVGTKVGEGVAAGDRIRDKALNTFDASASARGMYGKVFGKGSKFQDIAPTKAVKAGAKMAASGMASGAKQAVGTALSDRSRWKHTEKVNRRKGRANITDAHREGATDEENRQYRREMINNRMKDLKSGEEQEFDTRSSARMDRAGRRAGKMKNEARRKKYIQKVASREAKRKQRSQNRINKRYDGLIEPEQTDAEA